MKVLTDINLKVLKELVIILLEQCSDINDDLWPWVVEMIEIINSHDQKFLG
jgi:hypothetical protein